MTISHLIFSKHLIFLHSNLIFCKIIWNNIHVIYTRAHSFYNMAYIFNVLTCLGYVMFNILYFYNYKHHANNYPFTIWSLFFALSFSILSTIMLFCSICLNFSLHHFLANWWSTPSNFRAQTHEHDAPAQNMRFRGAHSNLDHNAINSKCMS